MKYFAYGSNMNPERMRKRNINFSQRKHAILRGYRLEFNKIAKRNPEEGYANIVPDKNEIVEGVLYEITKSDLLKLDYFEGYPRHYDRVELEVEDDEKREVKAEIHIAQPDRISDRLKPSRNYMMHLLVAKDFLSENYFMKLIARETID